MHRVLASVRSTHGQDGAIVLDIQQGRMFNLNLVGSRILELLEAGAPESLIAEKISREFDVSLDVVSKDLKDFVLTLEEQQLVEKLEQ